MPPENMAQLMPNFELLVGRDYSATEWLRFYKNIWTRNLMARVIDVQTDKTIHAKDAYAELVEQDQFRNQRVVKIKDRLEDRKILVQDALDIIRSADELLDLAKDDAVFIEATLSEKALAPAPEETPAEEVKVAETVTPTEPATPAENVEEPKVEGATPTPPADDTSNEAKV